MYQGFTRQEVSMLTGMTLNQLDYLSNQEVVKPDKVSNSRGATVLYSWAQTIELKIILELKHRKVPLKYIYSAIRGARKIKLDWICFEHTMVVVEDCHQEIIPGIWTETTLKWLKESGEKYTILFDAKDVSHWYEQMANKDLGTNLYVIPGIKDFLKEIKKNGEKEIPDFEERISKVA